LLGGVETAAEAADGLVASALEAGGEDNVTVVVVFVHEGDPDPDEPGESGAASRGDVRVGPESRTPAAKHGRLRNALPREWGGSARRPAGWLRRHRVWVIVVTVVVVLGLVVGGFALFNSTVYFVGARDDQVLLYRGMPYSVLGIDLYRSVEVSATRYSTLDQATKAKVDANELVTKEQGQNFLRALGVAP
jgi:PPM family protein phosphatase